MYVFSVIYIINEVQSMHLFIIHIYWRHFSRVTFIVLVRVLIYISNLCRVLDANLNRLIQFYHWPIKFKIDVYSIEWFINYVVSCFQIFLAMSGLLSIGMAIIFTYGVGLGTGIMFGPIHQITPFMLLGMLVKYLYLPCINRLWFHVKLLMLQTSLKT
jgi:hypothetical protein